MTTQLGRDEMVFLSPLCDPIPSTAGTYVGEVWVLCEQGKCRTRQRMGRVFRPDWVEES